MKYTHILAVAVLLFVFIATTPVQAETPAPGTKISFNNPPPNTVYWKQRFNLIEATGKWIESVKSYRNAFDLDRSPLTEQSRQCLLAKIGQGLFKAYYVTSAISGDPMTIAGAEANYNYFTELVKHWCGGGDGQRGLKLYEHVVEDMGSETNLPFSKIIEAAESKPITYGEVSLGKSMETASALSKTPSFWKMMRLVAFGPTHPLSASPVKMSTGDLMRSTVEKAKAGDVEARRALVILGIVGAAAASSGLPAAALGL